MAETRPTVRSISTWRGGAAFEHRPPSGVRYTTDAVLDDVTLPGLSPEGSAGGPRPMELLLGAVGGCTGVDLLNILTRMRIEIRSLRITVEGQRAEQHPRVYSGAHILYELETEPVDPARVRRAVELSTTKYCGASATLAATGRVTYTLRYAGEEYPGEVPGARPDRRD